MKRRWIKLIALALVALILSIAGLVAWLSWPTSGTLVGQASRSDIQGLKRSLFLGADINGYSMWGWHGDIKGETPLTSAIQHGSLDTVEFLLSRGADPNQRGGSGMPPICRAAIHDRLDVTKALIEGGAEPGLPNVDSPARPGKRAIDYARSEGHNDLADYLKQQSEQGVPLNR